MNKGWQIVTRCACCGDLSVVLTLHSDNEPLVRGIAQFLEEIYNQEFTVQEMQQETMQ